MNDTPEIIRINDVSRRFGRTQALDHVNLTIKQGELFGILGPDGAGKTTLMRLIAGVLNPSDPAQTGIRGLITSILHPPSGHIIVAGSDTVTESEAVKARMGYMPQAFGLYGDLSVEENLTFAADVFGVMGDARRERMNELLAFASLEKFRDRRAGVLSGGMKKKLALACALLHRPRVLLLDEPTTGVDPVARREFWDLLSGLHSEGITTVVTMPYMDEAERCNRVALLFRGSILATGTPDAIKSQVPGKVLAIRGVDMRAAENTLTGMNDVIDVQTYGDQLNLIVGGDMEKHRSDTAYRLEKAGLTNAELSTMPVRMEEAFIYLINKAREAEAHHEL